MPIVYRPKSKGASASKTNGRKAISGFTVVEALIVVGVALTAAAIVFVNAKTTVRNVRLSTSGTNYANLLQQGRLRAVRDDRFYSVIAVPGANPPFAFVDIGGAGNYVRGYPMMAFSEGVLPKPFASGPGLANLEAQFLPPGAGALASVDTTDPGPTFGPRGLPCRPQTAGGYTTCPFLTPTSFITFLQNQEGGVWEAITVTPAGRIRQWRYDGSNWNPLN